MEATLQEINYRLTYPSLTIAHFILFASLKTVFSPFVKIINPLGELGLQSFCVILGRTSKGKASIIRQYKHSVAHFTTLYHELFPANAVRQANLAWQEGSIPSSKQGLHTILEAYPTIAISHDEFADFLKLCARDEHKINVLSYLTDIYTRPFDTDVHPGRAIGRNYKNISHPRVNLFACSQTNRFLQHMKEDLGDSGFFNRCEYLCVDGQQDVAFKDRSIHTPLRQILPILQESEKIIRTVGVQAREVPLSPDACELFKILFRQHNNTINNDPYERVGNRIMEQACKNACIYAFIDSDTTIQAHHLQRAWNERMNSYLAMKELMCEYDVFSDEHPTMRAVEQILMFFERTGEREVYLTQINSYSRAYRILAVQDKERVIRYLITQMNFRVDNKKLVYDPR